VTIVLQNTSAERLFRKSYKFPQLLWIAALFPALLSAAGPAFVRETKINSGTLETNTSPVMTKLPDGRILVSWHQNTPTTGFARIYSGEGVAQADQFSLNPNCGSGWRYGHVVAPLANGGIASFWGGGCHTLSVQEFNPQFSPVRGDFELDLGGVDWPRAFALSNGDILVAGRDHASPSALRMIRLDQTLTPRAKVATANVNATGLSHNDLQVAAAVSPSGEYAIAWSASSNNLFARRFNNSGSPLGDEFIVNSSAGGSRNNPSLAYNNRNELWIAWDGASSSGNREVFLRRFAAGGAALGDEVMVNEYTRGGQTSPSLGIGADGTAAVAWTSPDDNGNGVFARVFYADGVPATTEFQVNQAQSGDQSARSTMISDGKLILAWRGNGSSGEGVYMTVFALDTLSLDASTTLPAANIGAAYTQTMRASGGTSPYTWSIVSGSLPPGLALASSGVISGTPATVGTWTFVLRLSDGHTAFLNKTFTLSVTSTLTIDSPATLPPAMVGATYYSVLSASGGSVPYKWVVTSGNVPPGLTLSGAGGLSGTATSAGTWVFSAQVSDNVSTALSKSFSMTVIPAAALTRAGVLSHIAAGGSWVTSVTLVNNTTLSVAVKLVLHADDGSSLSVPFVATQLGVSTTLFTASLERVLIPKSSLLLELGNSSSATSVGWIDVLSSGPVRGHAIFRDGSQSGTSSEGTVPLDSQLTTAVTIPFDNSGGFVMGVALANVSAAAATVNASIWDADGTLLGSQPITIQANGHSAFVLPDRVPVTSRKRGIVTFENVSGGQLAGLGLRFSPLGTFTSVPVMLP
jgi:hypothetical protein